MQTGPSRLGPLGGPVDGASAAPGARAPTGWRSGPGACALARPFGLYLYRSFPTSMRFAIAGHARSATLWLSLGQEGGVVLVYLAQPWGLEGLPGGTALEGQQVRVPAGSFIWLTDSVPHDNLVVQVPAGSPAEVCALTGTGRGQDRSGLVAAAA